MKRTCRLFTMSVNNSFTAKTSTCIENFNIALQFSLESKVACWVVISTCLSVDSLCFPQAVFEFTGDERR